MQTDLPSAKEYHFAYHSGTDDFHFFGTSVWAVRFDFSTVYPSLDSSEFNVSKALLYLPQTGDSVRVELFSDILGSPGQSLAWAKAPVTSNNLEIPFPSTVQNDSLWLVVTYATNFANRFVSASAGGGSHSYFWNTNAQNPYFQSLSDAGYETELLFGLAGEFVLSGMDLELMSFDLEGTLEPREEVGPVFTVYNHSDSPVTNALIGLNVYSPSPDFAFYDEIVIPETIPPRGSYEFNASTPGFTDHVFALPGDPMQLKLRAALSSEFQSSDPQGNNISLIQRFSLSDPNPTTLAESFLRWDNLSQIVSTQDQYNIPALSRLYYFPILSDTLGNVASQIRFNWYDFNTLPRTSVGGDLRINGFSTGYGNQYQQLCAQASDRKSFVSASECRFNYNSSTDLMSIDLNLTNANTLLYNSATEYNLVSNLRLCVGLFRKETLFGSERYVIDRWLANAVALNGSLNAGETLNTAFTFALNNMPLSQLTQNYRLYYWLQLNGGGRIFYSAYSDFTGVVALDDEVQGPVQLSVTSNPLRPGSLMRMVLSGSASLKSVTVYNIRGQKIMDFSQTKEFPLFTTDDFPSSGIFLLRAKFLDDRGNARNITRKINIIK